MDSYLVISPLECTWQKDAHLIFPGDWSYKYTQKDLMSTLDYEIDEPVEISGEKNYKVFREEFVILEDVILALKDTLNRYHGVDEDYEYWDFVLGKDIRSRLKVIYILYKRLINAVELHRDIKIKVLSDAVIRIADDDRFQLKADTEVEKMEFRRLVDASKILKSVQRYYNFQLVEMEDFFDFEETHQVVYKESDSFNHKLYKIINKVFLKNAKVYGTLNGKNLKKIILKTHGLYNPVLPECVNEYQVLIGKDFSIRQSLKIKFDKKEGFYDYLADWLLYELPTSVIEDYDRCIAYARKKMPKAPVVANLFLNAQIYQMVIYGEWKKRGTVFSRAAHSLADEIIEGVEAFEEGVDFYYIWSAKCEGKYKSMPSYKSVKRETEGVKQDKDVILWCSSGEAEVEGIDAWLLKTVATSNYKMKEFLITLDKKIKRKLIYRPRDSTDWGACDYYKDIYDELIVDDSIENPNRVIWENFKGVCRKAKLVVVETEFTGVLGEALSMNTPVVIISASAADNKYFYRAGYREMLKEYKELGFFYTDPCEAAHFINAHYGDIEEIWEKKEVQDWREKFIEQYMYEVDDIDRWVVNEVHKLIRKEGYYCGKNRHYCD